MKYRPEIDGLRALAVVPVIFFHAGLKSFSGGYIGVDVFFVISGYLITGILLREMQEDRFSLVNFYERRARRILPALFVVMVATVPFAIALFTNASLNKFGNAMIGVSLFVSNMVFWRQQGYFTDAAELNPLLHTWSLAVEEQYYVFFPIFLLFLLRLGRNKALWVIIATAILSLLLSEWGWRNKPAANFFLAPTRCWELFAGSIVAFITERRSIGNSNLLSALGLASILLAIFVYDESTPFPSVYALSPVAGAMLILLYAGKDTIAAKILKNKFFVQLGLISYSAYLWHQPVLSFYRHYTGHSEIGTFPTITMIVAILALAFTSWKLVEQPFRRTDLFSSRIIFILSILCLTTLGSIGFFLRFGTNNFERNLAKKLADSRFVYFENMDERKFIEGRLLFDLKKVDLVVVGSSRIMQLSSSMFERPIFNFSVSGASIEDDIAILLEAVAKLSPKSVYIGADPWLLNKFNSQTRFRSIEPMYDYWHDFLISGNRNPKRAYLDTIEQTGLREGFATKLHDVLQLLRPIHTGVADNGHIESMAKKAYDGSHIYNEAYLNPASDISNEFDIHLNYGMNNFEYNETAEQDLRRLVSHLSDLGIDVTLVLSPYHPRVFETMKSERPIFLKLEEEFMRIAKDEEISIIGSYDPELVGCLARDFYDGMHPNETCMTKVLITTRIK